MQYQRSLGPLQGIAMTVTTFVGTGLMVLPAMSVAQAGSFAFFAWLITAVAILPIAFVFALMGSRFPSAGGASHYIGQVFGTRIERAVGWLFLSILLVGPAVAIKVAAAYLAILLDMNEGSIFALSLVTLLGMLLFSIAGLKNSARFQTLVVLLLIAAVIFLAFVGDITSAISITEVPSNWSEFHPTLLATGTIFWCFLGIEVMAHMGNEFKNPARDFPIALLGGIGIVVALYLTLVLLIAYHHTFGDEITNSQSLALLIGKLLGDEYKQVFSLGAYIIAFANVGVYILGFTRMVQSLAAQKALPHYFAKLNHKGTPIRAVSLVGIICVLSLAVAEHSNLTMNWFIEMTNGSFLLIYLLTCFTAIRLFKKQERWLACIASLSCLLMVSFIGQNMLFAGFMLSLAILWEFYKGYKSHTKEIHVQ
ncbi:L-methionine/branched-chain amino acid transporter [Marinomonas transparens]|uniref:L-methionine/branched-chain amino acid transporter n=1 Tax=Marinomonas transparens TaxID=2795388 RepID=A0A934JYU0_9GAMM|nr:L-methionine/branched-chain amino acid transporter [Marinomonas transparens]MBJ7539629.1 L-methionine/branched-chain amino acid transporter [Marinomonas transparens]